MTDTNSFPLPPSIPVHVPDEQPKRKGKGKLIALVAATAVLAGGVGTGAYFFTRPSAEDKAISQVHDQAQTVELQVAGKAQIMNLLNSVCDEFRGGENLFSIMSEGMDALDLDSSETDDQVHDVGIVIGTAIRYICPEYKPISSDD